MRPVVWASEPIREMCARLSAQVLGMPSRALGVSSADELAVATRAPDHVTFLDKTTLDRIKGTPTGPVIAICDDTLPTAIAWLTAYPWVSHVLSTSWLEHPLGSEHLGHVLRTIDEPRPRLLDWIKTGITGRRIRLTHASRRAARIERMTEFFDAQGTGSRTVEKLRDVAEELLTNAFYDAPVAAGAIKGPISRTQDIALPDDCACDLAYGSSADFSIVQVRDPFGSLTRGRLVDVLARCATRDMTVEVDETMGGAGLGMWRIFANASFVAISVIKNRHTEILVGIAKKNPPTRRPFAVHLFFRDSAKRRFWTLAKDHTSAPSSVDKSVIIVAKK